MVFFEKTQSIGSFPAERYEPTYERPDQFVHLMVPSAMVLVKRMKLLILPGPVGGYTIHNVPPYDFDDWGCNVSRYKLEIILY